MAPIDMQIMRERRDERRAREHAARWMLGAHLGVSLAEPGDAFLHEVIVPNLIGWSAIDDIEEGL